MNKPIDYRVFTQCGRMFIWSSFDPQSLLNELTIKGYSLSMAVPESEYQAQQDADALKQLELNHEHEGAYPAA